MANPFESSNKSLDRTFSDHEKRQLNVLLKRYAANAPTPHDFIFSYDRETVQKDENELAKKKAGFTQTPEEQELYFYSKVLELIIDNFSDIWLPGVLCRVSEYDDIKHGTDALLEARSPKGSQILRLLLDITSGIEDAAQKLRTNINNIERGQLQKIKYYASELGAIDKGQQYLKVIVGADRKQIVELGKQLLLYEQSIAEIKKLHKEKTIVPKELLDKKERAFKNIAAHGLGADLVIDIHKQLQNALDTLNHLLESRQPGNLAQKLAELEEWLGLFSEKEKVLTSAKDKDYHNLVHERLLTEISNQGL